MSYVEHFNLTEQPFRLTPDPDFVYWSTQHARAKAYMESTIWLADGFVVISGEIGSGKTTLLQSFLADIGDDIVYAVVSQTQLTATQFLQAVLTEFGFKPFKKRKVELLDMLNMFLIEQYSSGKKVVLIVDEAQNLSKKVLEEIRMLSGISTTSACWHWSYLSSMTNYLPMNLLPASTIPVTGPSRAPTRASSPIICSL